MKKATTKKAAPKKKVAAKKAAPVKKVIKKATPKKVVKKAVPKKTIKSKVAPKKAAKKATPKKGVALGQINTKKVVRKFVGAIKKQVTQENVDALKNELVKDARIAEKAIKKTIVRVKGELVVNEDASNDVKKNSNIASLSYLFIFCLVPLLFAPKSDFAQHHAKQGVVLFFSVLIIPIFPLWIFILMFASGYGFVKAQKGERSEIPVIYKLSKKISLQ